MEEGRDETPKNESSHRNFAVFECTATINFPTTFFSDFMHI